MTAKEMLEKGFLLYRDSYMFTKDFMKMFIDQLCKEQRDICSKELQKKVLMNRDETKQLAKIVVLNSPQPQIFEESK